MLVPDRQAEPLQGGIQVGVRGDAHRGIRAFAPGDLANSEAWQRILSQDPDEAMPPPDSHKKPLTPAQRTLVQRWIEQGAVYQNHWAYEPVARPAVPSPVAGAKEDRGLLRRWWPIWQSLPVSSIAFTIERAPSRLLDIIFSQ